MNAQRILAGALVIFFVGCGGDDSAPDASAMDATPDGTISDAAPDSTAADSTVADTGSAPTCAPDPGFVAGDVIDAPEGEWTFIDFPDAHCMNGTSTGIGINPSSASSNVAIYMQGGGACFDFISCGSVANQDGYGAAKLAGWASTNGSSNLFDRTNADNPIKDWSFVFVPYCTGDIHGGNEPDGAGGREFVGFENVRQYLMRLVPTFADATQVLLSGSSAGGFGAAYNYDQVQTAFGCDVDVVLVDDAGPPMADEYLKPCLQQTWRDQWGLNDTLPADCSACRGADGGGIINYFSYVLAKYPDRRIGLISSTGDDTIRTFFGYGYSPSCSTPVVGGMPASDFEAGLNDLRDRFGDSPGFGTFYLDERTHTYLERDISATQAGGISLEDWVRLAIEDDPAWGSYGP